jgi:polyisoprenoid-binding protein YceI
MPWVYDPGHSQITWSVKYVGLSLVHGMFTKIDCDLDVDGDEPTRWSANVTIAAASVDSGIERRDDVMRGEEYFEVEKYPTITFKSKRVERKRRGLSGSTTIKRSDYNFHAPPLPQAMSDEIALDVDVQATWQD